MNQFRIGGRFDSENYMFLTAGDTIPRRRTWARCWSPTIR